MLIDISVDDEQLRVKHICSVILELQAQGRSAEYISNIPIYIGNDSELNDIHEPSCVQTIDSNNKNDIENKLLVRMINDNEWHTPFDGEAILIS